MEVLGSSPRQLKEKSLDCRRRAEMTQVSIRLMRSHMRSFSDSWEELVQAAIGKSHEQDMRGCFAVVSVEDEEKQSWFESLGFRRAGSGEEFDLDGRLVASVRMEIVGT